MNVSREQLYREVWAEPMTTVAKRYDVSSNYLARICERLRIPRPGRGYWQQRAVGVEVEPEPLPDALPGDAIEWARDGAGAAIEPMTARPPRGPRPRAERADKHPLLVGARALFEEVRQGAEKLYVLPRKKSLVDIYVTPATLEQALKVASELFLFLEDRGHRVLLAPSAHGYVRDEIDVREGAKPQYDYGSYDRGTWHPSTPTIALVGDVAIGITIYETMEESPSVWRGGKQVRYVPPAQPATSKRPRSVASTPREYISKTWFPTGRLAVHAYAAEHVSWEQTWIEKAPGSLASMFEDIATTFEHAEAKITKLIEERKREAERQQREVEEQSKRWRREQEERHRREEEAARVKRIQEDVASWRLARDMRAFVAEAKQMVADAKCTLTKGSPLDTSLEWVLGYAETIDPLGDLRAEIRRVVSERESRGTSTVASPNDEQRPEQPADDAKELDGRGPSSPPARETR